MNGPENGSTKIVQAPFWALWMLGFFSLILLGGGGAWLTTMHSQILDNTREIASLKISDAITGERLTHIATALGEIKGQLVVVIARTEKPAAHEVHR